MHRTILSRAVFKSTSTCFDAKYRYEDGSIGDFEAGDTDVVRIECVLTGGEYGRIGWIFLDFDRDVGDDAYSVESSTLINAYFGKLATEDERERMHGISFTEMSLCNVNLECNNLGTCLYYIEESS